MMDDAKRYIEIYGRYREQRLEKKTFELYLSILKALKQIMQFFVDSSWSKSDQALLCKFHVLGWTLNSIIYRQGLSANSQANILQEQAA